MILQLAPSVNLSTWWFVNLIIPNIYLDRIIIIIINPIAGKVPIYEPLSLLNCLDLSLCASYDLYDNVDTYNMYRFM